MHGDGLATRGFCHVVGANLLAATCALAEALGVAGELDIGPGPRTAPLESCDAILDAMGGVVPTRSHLVLVRRTFAPFIRATFALHAPTSLSRAHLGCEPVAGLPGAMAQTLPGLR